MHKKICKLMFHNLQVEKGILHLLKSTSPNELVTEAATVVANECKELCKRNSGSVLQDRSHDGILTFSWDKFHKQLQVSAPCLLNDSFHGYFSPCSKQNRMSGSFLSRCHSAWKV